LQSPEVWTISPPTKLKAANGESPRECRECRETQETAERV
jgi:hypothetical protein